MKQILLIMLVGIFMQTTVCAQRIAQVPDSVRKKYQAKKQAAAIQPKKQQLPSDLSKLNEDSLIKMKLVQLATNNPTIHILDANIRITEAEEVAAKKSWMSSISANGNINELVVKNSPAASFFPKYNFGVTIPFDIFTKLKKDKKVAAEKIYINKEAKTGKIQEIKTEVLIRYENYKAKREIMLLQQNFLENEFSAYESAQKSYTDGEIKLDEMNKAYQSYLTEKSKLITLQTDVNVAVIQIEELIGVPFDDVIKNPL